MGRMRNIGSFKKGDIRIVGKNNSNWNGGDIKLICNYCKNEFEVNNSRKDTAKYCSYKCRNLAKLKIWEKKCGYCKKDFELIGCDKKNTKFCSDFCLSKWRSENFFKNKISDLLQLGKKKSIEEGRFIITKEHRTNLSKALRGKPKTKEHIKNQNESRRNGKGWVVNSKMKEKMSQTRKRLYSEGKIIHPFKGKTKENYEPLKRISESKLREKNYMFGKNGEKHPNYGKSHSEETISKIRNSVKGKNARYWNGKKFSEEHKQKLKDSRAKQKIPLKDTKIEVKIQKFLKQLGIEHITHFYIKDIENKYRCDILIPLQNGISQKTIIECDGDYFHSNPLLFPNPTEWQKIKIDRDSKRNQQLLEKGYRVIRLWESDIKIMKLNEFEEKVIILK